MVVDRATRYLTLVPLSKIDGTKEVWTLIEDSLFLPFGYPVVVVHARDPRFISEFWKDTMRSHGILPHFITAYQPQTDGLSEALVKKMTEVVSLVSSEDEWARDLPRIQACINHSWHSSLSCPASSLLFGYNPRLYRGAPAVQHFKDECWEEHFLRVESDLSRASFRLVNFIEA